MARSYRKTPIMGNTGYSEKFDKQKEHRRWRVALRGALAHERWERAAWDKRDSGYDWNKDGKQWFGPPFILYQHWRNPLDVEERWVRYRKWLRK